MFEQESKKPGDIDMNAIADWEGADEIEQDLQDKIRSKMENQEPKIEKTKIFELTDSERELIRYSLHQVMNEGLASIDERAGALLKKIKGEE